MLRAMMVIAIFYRYTGIVFSQNPLPDPSTSIQSIMESMEEHGRLPEDFTDLLDQLDYLRENPLNLNQACREELEKLFFLTDFQIHSLLDYRKDHGPLLSLYELPLVFGFDSLTVSYMLPFVRTGEILTDNRLHLNQVIRKGTNEIIVKEQRILQTPEGYHEVPGSVTADEAGRRYPGSRDRLLMKYRYHFQKRIYCGLTLEKDAGEEFFKGSNRHGFDFYSGYVQINDLGPLRSVLIGDYRITAGQGLTLWSGPAFSKSYSPSSLYRRQDLLRKYGSTDENLFFRGIAVSIMHKNFSWTAFFSSKPIDVNITDTLTSGTRVFSSFQQTGYHRTPAEVLDEKVIGERAAGTNLTYRNRWLKIGSTLVGYHYSGIKEEPDELYRKYEFWGNQLINAGLDYSLSFQKVQLFGETSWGNNAMATLNGIVLIPHQRVIFSLLQRYYDPQYYARYNSAISENSAASNENALYLGMTFQPVRFWKISAYADFFRFPWMTYRLSQPSSGSEIFVQADFNPVKNLMFYLRFSKKTTESEYSDNDDPVEQVENQNTNNIRIHCRYEVSRNLKLQSRVEYKVVVRDSTNNADGFLIYQDLVYRFSIIPVQLSVRFSLYRIDDYSSRIYAYEDDVLYSYSSPALFDEGSRIYILLRYDMNKNLTWWLKWGQTCIDDASLLGSGLDEIPGNKRSEIKLQLRWTF
jgi:hypothetical protein